MVSIQKGALLGTSLVGLPISLRVDLGQLMDLTCLDSRIALNAQMGPSPQLRKAGGVTVTAIFFVICRTSFDDLTDSPF